MTAGCRGSRLAASLGWSEVSGGPETAVKGKDGRPGAEPGRPRCPRAPTACFRGPWADSLITRRDPLRSGRQRVPRERRAVGGGGPHPEVSQDLLADLGLFGESDEPHWSRNGDRRHSALGYRPSRGGRSMAFAGASAWPSVGGHSGLRFGTDQSVGAGPFVLWPHLHLSAHAPPNRRAPTPWLTSPSSNMPVSATPDGPCRARGRG